MTFKDLGGENGIKFVVSEESKEPRVMLRQRMPLTSVAIVEKALGENRFVISDADTPVQLTAKQEKLNNLFNQLNDYGCMKTPELSKIKVGDVYLYRSSDELCVYRVCILGVEDMFVSFRLIDFGICKTANYNSLYIMSAYFDDIRDTPAFVTRINLPPDEILHKYGLPTSSMIKQGDIVEVIKFTTTEPQFGIFGFALNNKYRAKPEKFTTGFNEEQKKNWLSLFDSETMFENPCILPGGYQSLGQRELDNCLALVSYVKALDKVYVHDFESAVRLSMMQERMDIIYGNEEFRKNFVIGDWDKLVAGFGCVAYNKTLNAYVRVKVVSISKEQIEVFPADVTHLGTFFVARDEVFRVPSSLSFPRQHLTIRMCRDSESSNHYMMTKLARCVIPTGTLVILNSDEDGLVTIRCANAPDGVLKKIGFFEAGLSKARAHDTYQKSSFGADFKPERIEDLSESMSKLKCMSKSKSIVKKPNVNVSSSKMAQSKQDVAKTAEVVESAEQKV